MNEPDHLVVAFQANRPRLRAIAYRMLGALAEADDAVQETWLRLSRSDHGVIDNLPAWLTTIIVRICLNVLRSRKSRQEDPVGVRLPDPVVSHVDGVTPEDSALLADSVGLALQVVIETLAPAERLAFVLHDMFDVPFDEIAVMVDRSPAAARQLASRARRRVRGYDLPAPDHDPTRQRKAVDAFFAAARCGDFDALVGVLHPEVVLRADEGTARPGASVMVKGAAAVAGRAMLFDRPAANVRQALVNGLAGVVITVDDTPVSVLAFTVTDGLIVAIDVIGDPERLSGFPLASVLR